MTRLGEKRIDRAALVTGIVMTGMLASLVFHHVLGVFQHKSYPLSTFLFRPDDALNDFKNMYHIVQGLNPYYSGFRFDSVYFPVGSILFYPFTLFGSANKGVYVFLSFFLLIYAAILSLVLRKAGGVSVASLLFLAFFNYPMLFALDRANIEIYLFLFLALFAYFYHFKKADLLADVFLALAISMKLYPGVLVVLYLRDRKFKHLLYIVLMCLAFSALSLLSFKGTFSGNVTGLLKALSAFGGSALGLNGIQHSASLFSFVRIIEGAWLKLFSSTYSDIASIGTATSLPYTIFVLFAFIALAYLIIQKKMSDHDAWLILIASMIIFPTLSFDYKLISLLIPLLLLLAESDSAPFTKMFCVSYGLLLIPKDYVMLRGDISLSSALDPVILIIMICMCLFRQKGIKEF